MIIGRSSTQLADFIRRSAELAGIVVAWAIYRAVHRADPPDAALNRRVERRANRIVGIAMIVSGVAMAVVAVAAKGRDKGNVIPGLVIALLGVTTNSWFWWRYRRLNRAGPDPILAVQASLYRAKSLVDACVTASLLTVTLAPATDAARWMDVFGTITVAVYLLVNGISTLRHPA